MWIHLLRNSCCFNIRGNPLLLSSLPVDQAYDATVIYLFVIRSMRARSCMLYISTSTCVAETFWLVLHHWVCQIFPELFGIQTNIDVFASEIGLVCLGKECPQLILLFVCPRYAATCHHHITTSACIVSPHHYKHILPWQVIWFICKGVKAFGFLPLLSLLRPQRQCQWDETSALNTSRPITWRRHGTGRRCSKIKRRHQLGHNDSSRVGRASSPATDAVSGRAQVTRRRPTVRSESRHIYGLVVVAAGEEAFFPVNKSVSPHGIWGYQIRPPRCSRWSRSATAMMVAARPRARECSEAARFIATPSPPSLSAFSACSLRAHQVPACRDPL